MGMVELLLARMALEGARASISLNTFRLSSRFFGHRLDDQIGILQGIGHDGGGLYF